MTTIPARQPKGVPIGGQFAADTHPEPAISLAAPTIGPEFVNARLAAAGHTGVFGTAELEAISRRLNASRDFTDRNIAAVADEVHTRSHGYTLTDAATVRHALKTLRSAGATGEADALERVLKSNGVDSAQPPVAPERPYDNSADDSDEQYCRHPSCKDTNWGGHNRKHLRGSHCPPLKKPALPDGRTAPVPSNDPRVQAGQIFDQVEVEDWATFHRRREGVFPGWPYAMRFQANRPMSEEEKRHFAGLVGYTYAATVRGESLGDPHSDSPYSFVVSADTTKTRSDDLGIALEEFEDQLPAMIREGSPVRKTDRSGPGTKGTRLVAGFNDPDLKFEIYYDEI